jgi:hypothetical protein
MSVDERSRLQLAEAAKRVFGADEGITLMELLPPVGWADVATKQDLAALEGRIDARFDSVEARTDTRFERMEARFDRVDARFDSFEARTDSRFERMDAKFEILEYKILGEMHRELRNMTWKLFAMYGATTGAMIGALVAVTKL